MAKEYLSGQRTVAKVLNLSDTTYSVNAELGMNHQDSPFFVDLPDRPRNSSTALSHQFKFQAQHWTHFGSVSGIYSTEGIQYFLDRPQSNLMHRASLPVALRVGRSEDFIFTPDAAFQFIQGSLYQSRYGFGISGVIYRESYKQSTDPLEPK